MLGGISSAGGVKSPKKRSKPRGKNCMSISEETTTLNGPGVSVQDVDIVGTSDFSFCFWYKRPSGLGAFQTSGQNPRMFAQAAGKSNAMTLAVGEVSGVLGSCLEFKVTVSSSDIIHLQSSIHGMFLDRWSHIAVVCDRSSASDSKIYVDGVALTMETQTMDSSTDIDLGGNFTLGFNPGTSGSYGGKYKDWMFYSKALGSKEISKIYNHHGKKRLLSISQLKTDLEFYLPLGDVSGDHATNSNGFQDISGNDRHGTGATGTGSGSIEIRPDSPS